MHAITVNGPLASWQRFTTSLDHYGFVTPLIPISILHKLLTDVWFSESSAAKFDLYGDKIY